MKIKLIALSFVFLANTCSNNPEQTSINNDDCEQNLKATIDSLDETRTQLKNNYLSLFPVPSDINSQNLISITDYERNTNSIPVKKERYKVSGIIDTNKDTIDLIIPVTNDSLKIVNYINASTSKTNAILIILDENKGEPTDLEPVTGVISKKIKISEIGLPKNLRQLFVFVLHDDSVNNGHIAEYKKCITNNPNYERNNVCLFKLNINTPLERGGDIVP